MTAATADATTGPIQQTPWFVVHCAYTPAAIRQYFALAQRRALKQSSVFLIVIGVIVVLTTCLIPALQSGSPSAAPAAPLEHPIRELVITLLPYPLILLGAWWWIHWWMRRKFAARQMQKFGPLQRPRSFWFTSQGVSMREPLVSAEYLWQAFIEWRETPDLFILYFSDSGAAELLMKSAIGDASAIEQFRQMLRTSIRTDWHAMGFPVMAMPQPSVQR
jgi:hypothetical protein